MQVRACNNRGIQDRVREAKKKAAAGNPRRLFSCAREEVSVLGRPGSDLLFQALRLSTIGAGEFNGRVRDGIGFRLPAKTTRRGKDRGQISDVRDQFWLISADSV